MKAAASSREVRELLGDIDDLVVERILDTGATVDQLQEAIDDVRHERDTGAYHAPSATAVAEVKVILEDLVDDDDADEDFVVRAMD